MKENIINGEAKQKATQAEHERKIQDLKKSHDQKLEQKQEEIRGLSTEIETVKFEAIQKNNEINELKNEL
jgi:TolA-binding protein